MCSVKTKARLRLQAAVSLLRLSTVRGNTNDEGAPNFATAISRSFVLLAITIQDPCYQVRVAFVNKLLMLLTASKLPAAYNVIPFLSIHDPEADVIMLTRAYIMHQARIMPKSMSYFLPGGK